MTDVRELVLTAVPDTVAEPDYDEIIARGQRRRRGRKVALGVAPVLLLGAVVIIAGLLLRSGPDVEFAPIGPGEAEDHTPDWHSFTDAATGISLRYPARWYVVEPPTARGPGHVVTVASPGAIRGPYESGCVQEPSAGWPKDGAVVRVYDHHGQLELDIASTRPDRLEMNTDSQLRPCNWNVHGWGFQLAQHGRQVDVVVYVGRDADPRLNSEALAVLNTIEVQDLRPATPQEELRHRLQRAHQHMTDGIWNSGGLQSWGWAVDELDAALAVAEPAGVQGEVVTQLRQLREDSAAILQSRTRLVDCQAVMADPREDDPSRYDRCYEDVTASRQLREALHDRLVAHFSQLAGLEEHH